MEIRKTAYINIYPWPLINQSVGYWPRSQKNPDKMREARKLVLGFNSDNLGIFVEVWMNIELIFGTSSSKVLILYIREEDIADQIL